MKKYTFAEILKIFSEHNEKVQPSQFDDDSHLTAVAVFKQGPWFNKEYSEEERSYRFRSDNKYFISGMGGNSLYADCITGSERYVRLDWYLRTWEIDYCYLENE